MCVSASPVLGLKASAKRTAFNLYVEKEGIALELKSRSRNVYKLIPNTVLNKIKMNPKQNQKCTKAMLTSESSTCYLKITKQNMVVHAYNQS